MSDFRANLVELIPDQLYWIPAKKTCDYSGFQIFDADKLYKYGSTYGEFGPLHLNQIYRYCTTLERKLREVKYSSYKLLVIGTNDSISLTCQILLLSSYLCIVCRRKAQDINKLWYRQHPQLRTYRDSSSHSTDITILDCLKAFEKAIQRGWFSYETFNCLEYEKIARYEYGDMNWIVPGAIMAFSSPDDRPTSKYGNPTKMVMKNLQEHGVTNVLRLNEPFYDRRILINGGVKHFDVHYPDGTNPKQEHVEQCLDIWRNLDGPIAVHCRAGLGRTGTQIGIWMMESYGITAREGIAWMRMCRNGMCIAQQSDYLCRVEKKHFKPCTDFTIDFSSQVPGKKRGSGMTTSTRDSECTKNEDEISPLKINQFNNVIKNNYFDTITGGQLANSETFDAPSKVDKIYGNTEEISGDPRVIGGNKGKNLHNSSTMERANLDAAEVKQNKEQKLTQSTTFGTPKKDYIPSKRYPEKSSYSSKKESVNQSTSKTGVPLKNSTTNADPRKQRHSTKPSCYTPLKERKSSFYGTPQKSRCEKERTSTSSSRLNSYGARPGTSYSKSKHSQQYDNYLDSYNQKLTKHSESNNAMNKQDNRVNEIRNSLNDIKSRFQQALYAGHN
jgi:cell division cycle 14